MSAFRSARRSVRSRRVATGLALAAMVVGAGLLVIAALGDSSDVAVVVCGVGLVCVGGLASVLTSPSVSVVESRRHDPHAGAL